MAATGERLRRMVAPGSSVEDALVAVEEVYASSGGEASRVPWSHTRANPALVAWLDRRAPGLVRCGARVAVVGCGLGQDAVLLAERGYDVLGFDASASAIEHARRLHPEHASSFVVADLRDLPTSWRHRFDLVVEVHTLQALPPEHRASLASGIAELVAPHGRLVAIARGRADASPLVSVSGPPYPFTPSELIGLLADQGLALEGVLDDFEDNNDPPVRRLRGCFTRAGA